MAGPRGGQMNFKDLASNLEMEKEEYLEMIGLFLETTTNDLTYLYSALERAEGPKAASAVHSIKGAAANLGLTEIHELAQKIEMEALKCHLDRDSGPILMLQEKVDLVEEQFKQESKAQGEKEKEQTRDG